jgi:thiosulfate/3-mercaptopyruvate sulfurtransferase
MPERTPTASQALSDRFHTLIEPRELLLHLKDPTWVIVDCRFSLADAAAGERAYASGHIPGAVYAHLDRDLSSSVRPGTTGRHPLPSVDDLERKFRDWGLSDTGQIVAYDDSGGAFASRLWWLSRWVGHLGACVLNGGLRAYQQAGGRLTSKVTSVKPGAFSARVDRSLVIEADDVNRWRQSDAHRLLDAREVERFRGDVEPIDPVPGRIPGAHSLPFAENLAEGVFKSPAELRSRFQNALGPISPQQTAVYCGSGVTACHNILAAAYAGIDGLKLYAGSYSEWLTDPSRPVARGED